MCSYTSQEPSSSDVGADFDPGVFADFLSTSPLCRTKTPLEAMASMKEFGVLTFLCSFEQDMGW